jgi:hypothetical protein
MRNQAEIPPTGPVEVPSEPLPLEVPPSPAEAPQPAPSESPDAPPLEWPQQRQLP